MTAVQIVEQTAAEIEQAEPIRQIVTPATLTPLAMIEKAVASNANVETLERLMALQERYEANEAKKEFDAAIAAAKAEIKPITKNKHVGYTSKRTNDTTDYDHEDLPQIARTVDPILTKHGLSYRYKARQDGLKIEVTCIISHRRGHREETTLDAAPDTSGSKNPLQAIGSAATYLQRYTLKLALGLAAAKDDDARNVEAEPPKTIDEAQFRLISDLLEQSGADEDAMLAYFKVDGLEMLTQAQYRMAEAMLRKKIKGKKASSEKAQ